MTEFDIINKAQHYNSHPSGIEAIEICRHMSGDWFNVFKYVFRADHKNGRQDIEKALYYAKDGVAHPNIGIRLPSWDQSVTESLMVVMDSETDPFKYVFFNAILMESPAVAKQYVQKLLDTWPTDE